MRNLTHRLIQSGHFFPKSVQFFEFSKNYNWDWIGTDAKFTVCLKIPQKQQQQKSKLEK